jgi:3-phenylpropionate/trans-cinnamate dioxygenase ferredoxin subunit
MNDTQFDPDSCEFIPVADQSELPDGERLFVEIDDYYLVIFNIANEYYAIADLCSHDDGPLGEGELEGHQVACPRHGARFDVRTGEALTLPAVEDIPAYPVRVCEEQIEVGLPKE